jgi:hypothetical protein
MFVCFKSVSSVINLIYPNQLVFHIEMIQDGTDIGNVILNCRAL